MAKDNIAQVLKEATQGLLTEESLSAIEKVFNEAVSSKVQLNVEQALVSQDEEYAAKLKNLLEAIDTDHSQKMIKIAEAIDNNNAKKLTQVVNKYRKALYTEAKGFEKNLVKMISMYMEKYIDAKIPAESINEAVRNRQAFTILENLRRSLAIDTTLMKESVRDAVIDGKKQINEAHNELENLRVQNEELQRRLDRSNAELVFEHKTAHLSEKKRTYARKVLSGKSAQFIAENLDYTIGLFDKSEQERVDVLKEQAKFHTVANEEVPLVEQVNEDNILEEQTYVGNYMSELRKY